MTREGIRPLAALVAVLLVAALLTACGSSNSDSSGSTTATSSSGTTETTTAQSGAQRDGSAQGDSPAGKNGGGNQSSSQDERSQSQQSGDGSGSKNVAAPLEVSGGGSAQFRTKGGDNSIQEFGDESGESELQEAAEAVYSFYVARAEEQWDTACSYLSKSNIEQLEQLGSHSPQFKDAGCAQILKAFTRPLPAAVDREITTVDAGSLRREGEQGFLIYFGADHVKYAMPLRDEDGSWKVTALSGTTLG